jgi:amidohydrolase
MRSAFVFAVIVMLACATGARAQQSVDAAVERDLPAIVEIYKKLHAAPELSGQEEKTSAFLAADLRRLGFEVTERVGKYRDPKMTGYGVVAVMKNGEGPTVLVRADMDGLPVEEKTGLPYASRARAKNADGDEVFTMHACGHDVHMSSLLGTARALVHLKDRWRGTLVLIGQPAEEIGYGAQAMLDDGLYTRFPRPDFVLGLHDHAEIEAGKIGVTEGFALANADTVDITIRGAGGHGSAPESAKDPVVVAAQTILALQTIVSRESSPLDPVVVTVGSIHGGTRPNIIPDEVKLELTVRTYKEEVRKRVLAAIERVAKGTALAAGFPPELAPVVTFREFPAKATYNDPELTRRLAKVWEAQLGAENVVPAAPVMGAEDVGLLSLEGYKIPLVYFRVGTIAPERIRRAREGAERLPSLHSSLFAPVPEPTLRTGIKAMTAAVLDLMKP